MQLPVLSFLSGRRVGPDPSSRVLVYRCGELGDTLIAMQALWSVREHFVGASLSLLADRKAGTPTAVARNVLPSAGLFDSWLSYEPGTLAGMRSELSQLRFTDLVYLVPNLRSRWQITRDLAFFASCGIRRFWAHRGFHARQEGAPPLPAQPAESELLLRRLEATGIARSGRRDLALTEEERSSVERWLRRADLRGRPLIGVAAVSKQPSKNWPRERFAEVLRGLRRSHGAEPILVGGGGTEREVAKRLAEEVGAGIVTAGELGIRESAALLERCDLYLGNDSGPMHMAAVAGVPCVVPFSAQDWPGTWHPAGEGHAVLRTAIDCEGCRLAQCPRANECLTRIDVAAVLDACRAKLDERRMNGQTGAAPSPPQRT